MLLPIFCWDGDPWYFVHLLLPATYLLLWRWLVMTLLQYWLQYGIWWLITILRFWWLTFSIWWYIYRAWPNVLTILFSINPGDRCCHYLFSGRDDTIPMLLFVVLCPRVVILCSTTIFGVREHLTYDTMFDCLWCRDAVDLISTYMFWRIVDRHYIIICANAIPIVDIVCWYISIHVLTDDTHDVHLLSTDVQYFILRLFPWWKWYNYWWYSSIPAMFTGILPYYLHFIRTECLTHCWWCWWPRKFYDTFSPFDRILPIFIVLLMKYCSIRYLRNLPSIPILFDCTYLTVTYRWSVVWYDVTWYLTFFTFDTCYDVIDILILLMHCCYFLPMHSTFPHCCHFTLFVILPLHSCCLFMFCCVTCRWYCRYCCLMLFWSFVLCYVTYTFHYIIHLLHCSMIHYTLYVISPVHYSFTPCLNYSVIHDILFVVDILTFVVIRPVHTVTCYVFIVLPTISCCNYWPICGDDTLLYFHFTFYSLRILFDTWYFTWYHYFVVFSVALMILFIDYSDFVYVLFHCYCAAVYSFWWCCCLIRWCPTDDVLLRCIPLMMHFVICSIFMPHSTFRWPMIHLCLFWYSLRYLPTAMTCSSILHSFDTSILRYFFLFILFPDTDAFLFSWWPILMFPFLTAFDPLFTVDDDPFYICIFLPHSHCSFISHCYLLLIHCLLLLFDTKIIVLHCCCYSVYRVVILLMHLGDTGTFAFTVILLYVFYWSVRWCCLRVTFCCVVDLVTYYCLFWAVLFTTPITPFLFIRPLHDCCIYYTLFYAISRIFILVLLIQAHSVLGDVLLIYDAHFTPHSATHLQFFCSLRTVGWHSVSSILRFFDLMILNIVVGRWCLHSNYIVVDDVYSLLMISVTSLILLTYTTAFWPGYILTSDPVCCVCCWYVFDTITALPYILRRYGILFCSLRSRLHFDTGTVRWFVVVAHFFLIRPCSLFHTTTFYPCTPIPISFDLPVVCFTLRHVSTFYAYGTTIDPRWPGIVVDTTFHRSTFCSFYVTRTQYTTVCVRHLFVLLCVYYIPIIMCIY